MGVSFVMQIDPSITTTPFANVGKVSYYQGEEEILFSMHSVFRIGRVKQIDNNDHLWQVDLTLRGDNDPQLHALTECMREETIEGYKGWYRLGYLMIKMGNFNKAEELYEILLNQTTDERKIAHFYHMFGVIKADQGEYEEAIRFYEKSLKITQKTLSPTHPDLAPSYENIGSVYANMHENSKALSYYEKVLEIYQKTLPPNHPDLVISYNNIGLVYNRMYEYSKALSYYEKALEIYKKSLPTDHPLFATSYNNTDWTYRNMGDYFKALSYYERALDIVQRSLPPNHPHLEDVRESIEIVKKKF